MPEEHHVHFRTQRTVRALRVVVLVPLAPVIVGIELTFGRRDRPQAEITMTPPPSNLPEVDGPVLDQAENAVAALTLSYLQHQHHGKDVVAGLVKGSR